MHKSLLAPRGLPRNGLVGYWKFDEGKNLCQYSQQFDNAFWSKSSATVSPNVAIAPDGTLSADALIEDSSGPGSHYISKNWGGLQDYTLYTFSIYVKKGSRKWAYFTTANKAGSVSAVCKLNLETGATYAPNTRDATVTDEGNGWYRVALTFNTLSGASTPYTRIFLEEETGDWSYTGDPTNYPNGIYIWGAQFEQGSYATDYYPTTDKQLLMDYSKPVKNMLLPNQANGTADGTTTGFSSVGAGVTLSSDATEHWQGARCLKLVTAGNTDDGAVCTVVNRGVKPNTTYTVSVYLKGSGTMHLRFNWYTDTGSAPGGTMTNGSNITLTDTWTRYSVTGTTPENGRTLYLHIRQPASTGAVTCYCDGFQFEEGSVATPWEAPPNIGTLGSTLGADTNDPTVIREGLSFATDDIVVFGILNDLDVAVASGTGFTLAVTCTITGTTDYNTVFGKVKFGSDNEWGIGIRQNGSIIAYLRAVSPELATVSYNCMVPNVPAIIIQTYDGFTNSLYVNGRLVNSATRSAVGPATSTLNAFLGRRISDLTCNLNGKIINVAAWSKSSGQAQVTQITNVLKANAAEKGVFI